ncbi:MAG: DUF4404 family protein [Gemmataceae bacterium]
MAAPSSVEVIQAQLLSVARLLQDVHPLSVESQHLIGALVAGLSDALSDPTLSPAKLAEFTEATAHLVEAVHHEEHQRISGLRDRLQLAAAEVESHYPTLAGLGRRLIEALSNIGI